MTRPGEPESGAGEFGAAKTVRGATEQTRGTVAEFNQIQGGASAPVLHRYREQIRADGRHSRIGNDGFFGSGG